jgi:hypothetical protein
MRNSAAGERKAEHAEVEHAAQRREALDKRTAAGGSMATEDAARRVRRAHVADAVSSSSEKRRVTGALSARRSWTPARIASRRCARFA